MAAMTVQSRLVNEFARILLEEDEQIDARLNQERAERELWFQKQEEPLLETLKQQAFVTQQIANMRRQASEQQAQLDALLAEVTNTLNACELERTPEDCLGMEISKIKMRRVTSVSTMDLAEGADDPPVSVFGRIVEDPRFDALGTAVILVNTIFAGVALEYNIHRAKQGGPQPFLQRAISIAFDVFYLIELLLKLKAYGLRFFTNVHWKWNCFDFFLVTFVGISTSILMARGDTRGRGEGLTVMRIMRLLKMMKMLRVVRVMRAFSVLRVMFYSIVSSLRSLFWAIIMLSLIMYIFGVVLLQAAGMYLNEEDQDPAVVDDIHSYWSSVYFAMVTLFEATSGGMDWTKFYEPVKSLGILYQIVFLFYIAFQTFAVLNILTGIFVDASLDAVRLDVETAVQEVLEHKKASEQAVDRLFQDLDKDRNETISLPEWQGHLLNDQLKDYLNAMGIDSSETLSLFHELDVAGDGCVDINELREGISKLKGQAKATDMLSLLYDCRQYGNQLQVFMALFENNFAALWAGLARRFGALAEPPPRKNGDARVVLQRAEQEYASLSGKMESLMRNILSQSHEDHE